MNKEYTTYKYCQEEELFVYDWEVISENPIFIVGHCLDKQNVYKAIKVDYYQAFSYQNTSPLLGDNLESKNTQTLKYRTSADIYTKKTFIKKYSRWKRDLKGHMAEINTLSMFTASSGIDYTGWMNINSNNSIKLIERNIHPLPLVLSFDIEVSSKGSSMVMPYIASDRIEMISCIFQRYCSTEYKTYMICFKHHNLTLDKVNTIVCDTELEIIDCFFQLIETENPDIIIGFNIYSFDFNFLISKLRYYLHYTILCSRPILKHFTVEETSWESSAYGHNRYPKIKIGGRIIFDLILYFKRFKLEQYSLEVISQKFLHESKDEMSYQEMFECFSKNENLNKVAKYCITDSLLVLKLFNKFHIWNELCELSKIMRCNIEDIYTRGEQLKVTNQIIKECIDRNIVLTCKKGSQNNSKDSYKGAMVIDPKVGIHNDCVILDFQSLYPSIVIAFNICPSTVKNNFCKSQIGLFPSSIKKLLDARKVVKQKIKTETLNDIEKIVLDKKQNALKICANSMYGVMGTSQNKYFSSITCAESVTGLGREVLQKTVEFIKDNFPEIEIIYGDTDSCILKIKESSSEQKIVKLSLDICNKITGLLPKPMALAFEEYYPKIILMSKKRYIMMKKDRNLVFKGVLIARRGYCTYCKEIYRNIIDMIFRDENTNRILRYVDMALLDLINGYVPLEKLTMTKSVKELNHYKSNVPQAIMLKRLIEQGREIKAGERLKYIFIKESSIPNKMSFEVGQGYKMYMPEEVERNMLEVDYEYYISTQIKNQTDELIEIMGYKNYIEKWTPDIL